MPDSTINREQIQNCLEAIEKQLAFGPSVQWTHRNFESLSENIELKTGILLSVSTLKRVWASDYKSLPQKATLDALVQFIDYKDWFDFVSSSIHRTPRPFSNKWVLIVASLTVLLTLGIILIPAFLGSNTRDSPEPPSDLIEIDERIVPVQEADSAKLILIEKEDPDNE